MKPTSPSVVERRLARHDHRISRRHAYSGDYLFQPQTDPHVRQIQPRADGPARREFRRMTAEMLADQHQPKAMEMIVYALVTAIVAWPLISLLMLLAETVPG